MLNARKVRIRGNFGERNEMHTWLMLQRRSLGLIKTIFFCNFFSYYKIFLI
jgi:hypothetical protein